MRSIKIKAALLALVGIVGLGASTVTATDCWADVLEPMTACTRAGIGIGPCSELVVGDSTCPWMVPGEEVKKRVPDNRTCYYWVLVWVEGDCEMSHQASFVQDCWKAGPLSCPQGPPV